MTEALTTPFEGKEIRTFEYEGEIWFPLADLAAAWGVDRKTPGNLIGRNEALFKGMYFSDGDVTYHDVNERGLYLLMGKISADRLKNPQARDAMIRFQRWVPELIQRYRKKEIVPVQQQPSGIIGELQEARELAAICGKSPESFQAVILRKHGKAELADALQATVPFTHGESGQWMNPSEIGHECCLTAQQVNYWLLNHGFQYKDGPLWRLTPKGTDYGEEYVFEATSKHSEIRIRWNRAVMVASGLKRPEL